MKLVILDTSYLIYRSILTPGLRLTAADGRPTTGTYQLFRMLRKIVSTLRPTHLLAALDSPRTDLKRREIWPDYKTSRRDRDPAIDAQFEDCRKLITELGIPAYMARGWEADDVIYSAAKEFTRGPVVIVGCDKDLAYSLREAKPGCGGVTILEPFGWKILTTKSFKQARGYHPRRVPLYLALTGDKSDNFPGVPGIGKVGALKIVQSYRNIQEVTAAVRNGDLEGGTAKVFAKSGSLAMLEKMLELAQPREVNPSGCSYVDVSRFSGLNIAAASPLLRRLGIRVQRKFELK